MTEKLLTRNKLGVADGWSGGKPKRLGRTKASAADIARLNEIHATSLVQLRKDLLRMEEIYPSADSETLNFTSD